jgi:GT2 family glycosyltransferase
MSLNLTASLVLYHNDPTQYGQAIRSYLDGSDGLLYVVDNSSAPLVHDIFSHPRVRYLHAGKNLGFGKAHNIALSMIGKSSDFHLFLNPDVYFESNVLPVLCDYLASDSDMGALMPRINYPDGSLQRLCKLLPNPIHLFIRRFLPIKKLKEILDFNYEMHWLPQDRPSLVPSLSGCFLLVRTKFLQVVGGFDERFFMYMEDVDLVRRIGDVSRTVYQPSVAVFHAYGKGSYRSKKLLTYHLHSAVLYFSKWGWFYDRTRSERNRNVRHIRGS